MKKITIALSLFMYIAFNAQFKITVEGPSSFVPKEVYLYTLNGSKDILYTKEYKKGNSWQINFTKPYMGMLKLYFPQNNNSINFISENKDVKLKFDTTSGKIYNIDYLDESNALMNSLQDIQQKQEFILPALYQIKEYYKGNTPFGSAIEKEILRLSEEEPKLNNFPYINYYQTNYNRFLEKKVGKNPITHEEIIDFLTKSNEMLETSSLLRPILVAYLNIGPSSNVTNDVDQLITAVNTETPRGQTVLSELIEIFSLYDMTVLKEKYLTLAKNLKCTINDRLASTISTNKNTEMGSIFPNTIFVNPSNTVAKSIYDVKADKKVIVFWASTCSHCEAELPKLIEKYNALKSQKGEIIAFSLDSEKDAYTAKAKNLPWINDSELKGWYSSYGDKYNVHATPTYFILDGENRIIAKPEHAVDVISFLKLN